MTWKIYGYDRNGHYTWLTNIDCATMDEAFRIGRDLFGYLNVTAVQPLKRKEMENG